MSRYPIHSLAACGASLPGVALSCWRLDDMPLPAQCEEGFTEAERSRLGRLRFAADRRRYLAAHWGLRLVLAEHLNTAPATIALGVGPHGKPYLDGATSVQFNLSHSAHLAVVAVAQGPRPVGVDIEWMRPLPDADVLARAHFSADEYAAWQQVEPARQVTGFLARWTRKEAALKAAGTGLLVEARSFCAGLPEARVHCAIREGHQRHDVEVAATLFDEEYVVSVARSQPAVVAR